MILYGMSARSLALRLGCDVKEAEKIINDFYDGFPGIRAFTQESQDMLKEKGYITDIYGRRRHIPDGALPEYTVEQIGDDTTFNPLIGSIDHDTKKFEQMKKMYLDMLSKARTTKDKNAIINAALKDSIQIRNNSGFISRALRQCLNARIQGSAASITKNAMAMIHNDDKLNELGFRLLITVHDELIGEAPIALAQEATDRLCEVMLDAARVKCNYTPWSSDGYAVSAWYCDEVIGLIKKEAKSIDGDAPAEIHKKYPMLREDSIRRVLDGTFDPVSESLS